LRPSLIELLEADVFGVLPEALPAEVQVVLSDEAVAVGAGAAAPGALPVLPGPGVPDVFVTHVSCGFVRKSPITILQRWSQFGKGRAVFVNRK